MINRRRLGDTFVLLAKINSVSAEEGEICAEIARILTELGAELFIDDAGRKTGGSNGNLIAKLKGEVEAPPMLLNAHLDTVTSTDGIQVIFDGETYTSDGTTILGADDKSAIAIIIEILRVIHENHLPCCPLEVVLTVSEEIGLVGAKHLDYHLISSKFGYSLDTRDVNSLVTQAPALDNLLFTVIGKDAHAGAEPEKGINAICLAAQAITDIQVGRIDENSTCNIGVIQGGEATNVVPSRAEVKAEARSHDEARLDQITASITESFEKVIAAYPDSCEQGLPRLEKQIHRDFHALTIPDSHQSVLLALQAAQNLGRTMSTKKSGGGSDANIFFQHGIITPVLGTGMTDVHSVRESVKLTDMCQTAELLLEIIGNYSQQQLKGRIC